MINDVIFNGISAREDWNIVLTNAIIPLPKVKTSIVDIKGADGTLDLSEVLCGDVVYGNRDIKLTFDMMDLSNYPKLISDISNFIHGKKVKVVFTNDDEFYYVGRCEISQWEYNKNIGKIVINITADPFKYRLYETSNNYVLDDFNRGELIVHLQNDRMRVSPILNVSGDITLTYEGKSYKLQEGEQQLIAFTLKEGDNVIKLTGKGSVHIKYKRGLL